MTNKTLAERARDSDRCCTINNNGKRCVLRYEHTAAHTFIGEDGWEWGDIPVRAREYSVGELVGDNIRLRSMLEALTEENGALRKEQRALNHELANRAQAATTWEDNCTTLERDALLPLLEAATSEAIADWLEPIEDAFYAEQVRVDVDTVDANMRVKV